MEEATRVLGMIDALLEGFMASFDPEAVLLIVTSDHGNLEDLSTKTHTRNPVPFIAAGSACREMTSGLGDLTDVTPAILRILG